MRPMIYLDMDGVLVDFELGVIQLLGKVFNDDWDTLPESFFKNLPKQPDADYLVDRVMFSSWEFGYNVGILTAIPRRRFFPLAEQHKREWIEENYPFIKIFKTGPYAVDKQTHCKPGDILIDDSHLNIPQWNAVGGHGILHKSAKNSYAQLLQILENVNDIKQSTSITS